ncbi:TOM (translocase of outer membrane) complex component [Balamuthia mandrillaris]
MNRQTRKEAKKQTRASSSSDAFTNTSASRELEAVLRRLVGGAPTDARPQPMSREEILEGYRAFRGEMKAQSSMYSLRASVAAPFMHKTNSDGRTALKDKKPVPLRCMTLNNVHEGKVFYCRTIEDACRATALISIVEDQEGQVTRLALYNYAMPTAVPEAVLPRGTRLALLDPFYKMAMDGQPVLRCDNPAAVVVFDPTECFPGEEKEERAPETADMEAQANAWKQQGVKHFSEQRFEDAVSCFSKALQLDPNNAVVLSNRAQCYLHLQHPWRAWLDASQALSLDPSSVKSHFRSATALVQLGRFDDAAHHMQLLEKRALNDPACCLPFPHWQRFYKAEQGAYDIMAMETETKKSTLKNHLVGHSDFRSPSVKVVPVMENNKGRGVVATTSLSPGTLVFASKALASAFPHDLAERRTGLNVDVQTRSLTTGAHEAMTITIIQRLRHASPDDVSAFYQLFSGGYSSTGKLKDGQVSDETKGKVAPTAPVIDMDCIKAIIRFNSFGPHPFSEDFSSEDSALMEKPTGLWLDPSYLNHSCQPNCNYFFVGDFMFVVTATQIAAGEELTVAYLPPFLSFSQRQSKLLSGWKFECRCPRCAPFLPSSLCSSASPSSLLSTKEKEFMDECEALLQRGGVTKTEAEDVLARIDALGASDSLMGAPLLPLLTLLSNLFYDDPERCYKYCDRAASLAASVVGTGHSQAETALLSKACFLVENGRMEEAQSIVRTAIRAHNRAHCIPPEDTTHFARVFIPHFPALCIFVGGYPPAE